MKNEHMPSSSLWKGDEKEKCHDKSFSIQAYDNEDGYIYRLHKKETN